MKKSKGKWEVQFRTQYRSVFGLQIGWQRSLNFGCDGVYTEAGAKMRAKREQETQYPSLKKIMYRAKEIK